MSALIDEFDITEEDDGLDKMIINVNFPPVLKRKMIENEESVVNLLQIATVGFNTRVTQNPQKGFGHIVLFLKSERIEHDFRIHAVYFSPTLDLENTNMTALISSTNNKELKRFVDDDVLSFYLSGKIVQKKSGELQSIVINKLTTKVDQTVYARRYQQQNLPSPPAFPNTIVDIIPNTDVDPNNPYEISNIKSFKDKWSQFAETRSEYENNKKDSSNIFDKWKSAFRKIKSDNLYGG